MSTHRPFKKIAAGILGSGAIVLFFSGCGGDPQEESVADLFHENYAFTVNDFFRAIHDSDTGAVGDFLRAGMEANITDGHDTRALAKAAEAGSAEVVGLLLKNGAEVDHPGKADRTALIYAAGSGSGESVRLLLEAGADPLHKDNAGWTALSLAARHGHERAAEMLAPVSKTFVDEALLIASLGGHTGVIDILLMNRANIQTRGKGGFTPLMIAAKKGHGAAVQILLEREADRFSLNDAGHTAAQIAKLAGEDDIAAILAGHPTSGEISGTTEDPLALRDENGALLGESAHTEKPASVQNQFITGSTPDNLRMENYRERRMPVVLDSVAADESGAKLRLLYGSHETIALETGALIPDSGLRIVELRHQTTQGKEGLRDASHIVVEDTATGTRHSIHSGENARSPGTYALLKTAAGQTFEARRGDTFSMAEGQGDGEEFSCKILDVRPDQVLIEITGTGRVLTLQRQ